ncbi:MAG: ribbon-helix-helix protein, CopG family [Actinomycetota bacterium]
MSDTSSTVDQPSDTTDVAADRAAFSLRLSAAVMAKVDERAKARDLSRNAWIEAALTWVADELPYGIADVDRALAAWTAPTELSGTDEPEMLARRARAAEYRRKLAAGLIGRVSRSTERADTALTVTR